MSAKPHKLARWMGGILTVGAMLVLLVVLSDRWSGGRPSEPISPAEVTPESSVVQPAAAVLPPQPAAVTHAPQPVDFRPDTVGSAARMIRVQADQTLATVNGVAITLKDLVPLPREKMGKEQVMSPERYSFLLDRAIEREVTFQTAQAQGVALTEAQRKRLEEMRVRSEQPEPGVFDTVQQNPANVAFEQRDATGLLLQAVLAERAGVPAPHVTSAQVRLYYQQHQAEYGALPAEADKRATTWEHIDRDIRLKLAAQVQAEHEVRLQQFREQLLAVAQIRKAAQ